MKIFYWILIFCLLSVGSVGYTQTSSRVNALLDEDNYIALESIKLNKLNADKDLKTIHEMEKRLNEFRKHKPVYLQAGKVAGAVVIIGMLVSSYQIYFPPTLRVLLTAFLTIKLENHGNFKLSAVELDQLMIGLGQFKINLNSVKSNLEIQRKFYCQTNVPHILCRI